MLGTLPRLPVKPNFDVSQCFSAPPVSETHPCAHDRLELAGQQFENSPFNRYEGSENPELMVITSGSGWLYAKEAVNLLRAETAVGILKLGTTWPLPESLILERMKRTRKVLFFEEVDPILETHIKALYADRNDELQQITFLGKKSGAVPSVGELSPELAIHVISKCSGAAYIDSSRDYTSQQRADVGDLAIERGLAFCPGCPHRACTGRSRRP